MSSLGIKHKAKVVSQYSIASPKSRPRKPAAAAAAAAGSDHTYFHDATQDDFTQKIRQPATIVGQDGQSL